MGKLRLQNEENMNTPVLTTERLILRPVAADDIKPIFECWMQDEDVSRCMYWHASDDIEETEKFVKYELENPDNKLWNRWIIVTKSERELIGTCLVYFNSKDNNWDISYNLGRKYWERGYATEAMAKALEYAANVLKMKECIAIQAYENTASEKVIKKLGFICEKTVPFRCNGGKITTKGKYYRLEIK